MNDYDRNYEYVIKTMKEDMAKLIRKFEENYKKENSMDGIKVAVEEKKVEEKAKYPCYKIVNGREDDRAIVLFTAPRRGFVVVTSSINNVLGMGCDTWAEDQFIPFHGTIKIEVD